MKKITIFLLNFLLLVGFLHVNAQAPLYTVQIAGPTSGCVGDVVTLTAVVMGPDIAVDTLLFWKQGDNYIGGANPVKGRTYTFTVSDKVERLDFTVEFTPKDCEMITSPVHPFQVIPKTILMVDNYTVCKDNPVEVTANLVTYGAQPYRYIWDLGTSADTTYTNKRLFAASELAPGINSFSVMAEMLGSSCNSEPKDFTITQLPALDPVDLWIAKTITCVGTLLHFEVGTDSNVVVHGTPTITWWIDGFEVPGENLSYLNFSFKEAGSHYVEARLQYPTGCGEVTNAIKMDVLTAPAVAISGNTLYCLGTGATDAQIQLTAAMVPTSINYTFQWYLNNVAIPGEVGFKLDKAYPAQNYPYNFAIQVTDTTSGCVVMSDVYLVIVNPQPIVNITASDTAICTGGVATLTAQIGDNPFDVTYQWYLGGIEIPNAHGTTLDVTGAGIYTFTATRNNGCVATSDSIGITVNPIPDIGIEVVSTVSCEGTTVSVSATIVPGGIYTWYENGIIIEGATSSTFTKMLTQIGTYVYSAKVTLPGAGCESAIVPATTPVVVTKDGFNVMVYGNSHYCLPSGATEALVELTAGILPTSINYTFQWYLNNNEITGEVSSDLKKSYPIQNYPYNFAIQVTDTTSGCVVMSDVYPVTITPQPVIMVDNYTICGNTDVEVTVNVNAAGSGEVYRYVWFADGGATNLGATYENKRIFKYADITFVGDVATFAVRAEMLNSTCQTDPAMFTITQFPMLAPVDILVDTLTTCTGILKHFQVGEDINASTHGIPSYSWWINGVQVPGEGLSYLNIAFDKEGLNDVGVRLAYPSGCEYSNFVEVEVFSAPAVTIYGEPHYCLPTGATEALVELTAGIVPTSSTYSFQWYLNNEIIPGEVGFELKKTYPAQNYPYNFSIQVTNFASGCVVMSDVYPVTINPQPVVMVDNYTICENGAVEVTARINVTGNGEVYRYVWFADGGATNLGATYENKRIFKYADITFVGDVATFYVRAEMLNTVCQSEPTGFTITKTGALVPVSLTAQPDTVCAGTLVYFELGEDLNVPVAGVPTITWWIDGAEVPGQGLSYLNIPFDIAGTHYVTAHLAYPGNSCEFITDSVKIEVKPAPAVAIFGNPLYCLATGATDALVELTAGIVPTSPTYSFQWYLNNEIIPGEVGFELKKAYPAQNYPYNFSIQVTNFNSGCVVMSELYPVIINPQPVVHLAVDKHNVCPGEQVTIRAEIGNNPLIMTYKWYEVGSATPISGAVTPVYSTVFTTAGTYQYVFTAEMMSGECTAISDTATIIVNKAGADMLKSITMIPSHGNICDGGEVTLTANVEDSSIVQYYVWYENGKEIPGKNLATILVSPRTVDQDTTNYIYNVVPVPFGGECGAAVNPNFAKTVHVIRNPIIELHGQHHVCDIYSEGMAPNDAYPNVSITAYKDGVYEAWHCAKDPYDFTDAKNTWMHYTWYLNGAKYDLTNFCNSQEFVAYLATNSEPYLVKVEYDNGLGCSMMTQDFEVYVHPQPVVTITATEDDICEGGQVTLRANLNDYNETNFVYQWYKNEVDEANKIAGATEPYYTTPALYEIGDITYYVTVKQTTTFNEEDTIKCFVQQAYKLTVHPKPIIDDIIVDKTNMCSGGQVTVTAIPSANNLGVLPVYTWLKNGKVMPGVNGPSFTESLIAIDDDVTTYTYNATVRYENSGCESSLTLDHAKTVTVYRNPIVDIAGDANTCETDKVYLVAHVDYSSEVVGNLTYTWYESGELRDNSLVSNGQYYAEYWAPRLEPYKFTVEVTRGDGCTSISDPFFVTVHELPVVNITTTEDTICEGGSVTLTANLNDYNTPYITYQWYKYEITQYTIPLGGQNLVFYDTAKVVIPGATERTYATTPLNETSFFAVDVYQTHSQCLASGDIAIIVTPIPVVVPDPTVVDTICNGDQVTMHVYTTIDGKVVTDGVTYNWFVNGGLIPNATTDTYTPTATAAGDYVYTVQSVLPISGCISLITEVATVTVKDAPIVHIEGPHYVCNAEKPTVLYAVVAPIGAPVTYKWYENDVLVGTEATQLVNNTPSPYPYVYVVEITDIESGCVVVSLPYTVTVEEFHTIGITANKTEVCAGETVTLTADISDDDNMNYQWYANGDTIKGATGPVYYANPDTTTIYTFTATQIESECVANSNIVTVTVIPKPEVTITPIFDTICAGEQVTFTATVDVTDPVTYTWYINGEIEQEGTINVFTYTFDHFGIFDVKVSATTEVASCTSSVVLAGTIKVKDAPKVHIEGASLVCNAADPTVLYAIVDPTTATVTYQWYENETKVGTASTQEVNSVASPNPYVYVVEITDIQSGCVVKSLAHTVYVEEFPVVGITANKTEVCAGETVTLTANISDDKNMNYQWYANGDTIEGATAPVYYANPDTTTIYTFTATQIESACVATSNIVTVTVIPKPVVTITPIFDTICAGEQVTFTATVDVTDPVTYTWYINGKIEQEGTINVFTYTFDHFGIFDVKVSATTEVAGCTSAVQFAGTIMVKDAPTVKIEGPEYVCNTENPATLQAVVNPLDAPVTYQWYLNKTPMGTNSTQVVTNIPSPNPYVYVVTITDIESGCVVTSQAHLVTVEQFPTVGISADNTEICAGATVKLTADVSGSNNILYQWYADGTAINGANNPYLYVYPTVTTVYTFTATQIESECVATSNAVTVTVVPKPVVIITPVVKTICEGEQVTFTASVNGNDPVTYTWYVNGDKQQEGTINVFTYTFDHFGTYNVNVTATTDVAGCTSALQLAGTITVKAAPSVHIDGPHVVCNTQNPPLLYAVIDPSDAPVTYQWFVDENPIGTNATQAVSNVPRPAPYFYKVTITDTESGCVVTSESFEVQVNAFNNVAISVDKPQVCEGTTIVLTADLTGLENYNMTYQWFDNATAILNATAPQYTYVPTVGTHNYTFVATQIGSNCYANSNTVTVIVNKIPDQPVLTITDDKICSGDMVTVSANIDGVYNWFRNGLPVANSSEKVINEILTANNNLTYYNYTAEVIVNGCTSPRSLPATVIVHPEMDVVIVGAHEVCDQALGADQLTLHAQVTGGSQPGVMYNYAWTYVQGNNPPQPIATLPTDPSTIIFPNNLPINDAASPYYVNVKVTAVSYGCTTTSPAHEVNVLEKPTVEITVDNSSICMGGVITAIAHPTPAATPENPYNYTWSLNGNPIPGNTAQVVIDNNLLEGVNIISVVIERAYASHSCFGSTSINVNVVPVPTLSLSQDIEGLQLPGMCEGGKVNLHATVVNFDQNFINPSDFNFQWKLNGLTIPMAQGSNYSDVLNSAGMYKYEVRAYINNALGCNAAWTAFDPVKVVPQATVRIAPKDENLYDVCQYAEVAIYPTLNITDPDIQKGYQYKWNIVNDWVNFTNQIAPLVDTLNSIGAHTYSIKVTFENPTCKAITSNERIITVTTNPVWTERSIYPSNGELCLGDEVKLHAKFEGGVNNQTNVGKIQWQYSLNGNPYVALPNLGGDVTHTPNPSGNYTYMVTYEPSNMLTGCRVDPYEFSSIKVFPTPTVKFVIPNEVPHTCANHLDPVPLQVILEGTPPFQFVIKGSDGWEGNFESWENITEVMVSPTVTTQYTIVSMNDASKCKANIFLESKITVVVSNVEVLDTYVTACDTKVDVNLKLISTVSKVATIVFAGKTWDANIVNSILTIDIPKEAKLGENDVRIIIDGCEYRIVINVGVPTDVTAVFTNGDIPPMCANDPSTTQIDLHIKFTGTPPFHYRFVGTDGTRIDDIVSFKFEETFTVTPKATTTYSIELLTDASICPNEGFVKPEITVTVTNVEFVNPYAVTCDNSLDVGIEVISSLSNTAEIRLDGTFIKYVTVTKGYNSLPVTIPNDVAYGSHVLTVVLDGCEFSSTVVNNIPGGDNSLIGRRWPGYYEVLVVNNNCHTNGGYKFTSYQWYKNGTLIPGATQQHYQDPNGVNGIYSVHLTGTIVDKETCLPIPGLVNDKVEFSTCDENFNPVSTIKVYPVPAKIDQPVTVQLDLTPAELEGAYLDIYDAKGAHIKQIQIVNTTTQVSGFKTQGTYFGRITTGTNEIKAVSFVIVK